MQATIQAVGSLATHNGFYTLRSVRTGDHRTFRVWTQNADSKFKPGARLIGMLTGPDNANDYRAFGEVLEGGRVHLWRKSESVAVYRYAALALSSPDAVAGQVDILLDARCRVCNRLLTTPESVESGIGPTCGGRE